MTTTALNPQQSLRDNLRSDLKKGLDPMTQIAASLFLIHALGWGTLFVRWATFSTVAWTPLATELALSMWPPLVAYLLYGAFTLVDLVIGIGLLRRIESARTVGLSRSFLIMVCSVAYYLATAEFYGACLAFAIAGLIVLLLRQHAAWSINYLGAFWLVVFFVVPMVIVLIVSLGERSLRSTVVFPAFSLTNLDVYFDDYVRFFGPIQGEYLYLRILGRSVWLAVLNTLICLLFGYPFAYWIVRQPQRFRTILIFLVMIPFWTNFLVRTYAWMLILRDSGLINNFWTITLHEQAVALAEQNSFFAWLASATSESLPLLFNQPAVFLGLFYGFLPFVVLPLYSNMEKLDWSLLEAAADLGANTWRSTVRVLIPLTMPGIVAASIIVFIPSLGSYVIPDLMGGGKVTLLGNLLQQQFMTARDWPFGSAIGFIMMAMLLLAILIYFRIGARDG